MERRWRVKVERHAGGGLYELEERTRFHVLAPTGQVFQTFTGLLEASYEGSPGWGEAVVSGVREVTIDHAAGEAVVETFEGWSARVPLRWSTRLSAADVRALDDRLSAFERAHETWRSGEDWSFDVSIPEAAIAADFEATCARWDELEGLLVELGVRAVDPRRLRVARKGVDAGVAKRVRRWFERGGHLRGRPRR